MTDRQQIWGRSSRHSQSQRLRPTHPGRTVLQTDSANAADPRSGTSHSFPTASGSKWQQEAKTLRSSTSSTIKSACLAPQLHCYANRAWFFVIPRASKLFSEPAQETVNGCLAWSAWLACHWVSIFFFLISHFSYFLFVSFVSFFIFCFFFWVSFIFAERWESALNSFNHCLIHFRFIFHATSLCNSPSLPCPRPWAAQLHYHGPLPGVSTVCLLFVLLLLYKIPVS